LTAAEAGNDASASHNKAPKVTRHKRAVKGMILSCVLLKPRLNFLPGLRVAELYRSLQSSFQIFSQYAASPYLFSCRRDPHDSNKNTEVCT
jgi:hypothetical protein